MFNKQVLFFLVVAVVTVTQAVDFIKLANQTIEIGQDVYKTAAKIKESMDSDNHDGCWLESYDRHGGSFPVCKPELQGQLGLCYDTCPKGLTGVGPVCWPSRIAYGRGVGKIPSNCGPNRVNEVGLCYDRCDGVGLGFLCWHGWSARNRHVSLPSRDCGEGMEYDAGLCYPRCEEGFKGVGPVCWTTSVPEGRGVGKLPNHCDDRDEEYTWGLCYKPCHITDTKPIGPLCWAETCPKDFPFNCGAVCVSTLEECVGMNAFMVKSGVSFPIHLFSEKFMDSIMDVYKIVKVLVGWKNCLKVRFPWMNSG